MHQKVVKVILVSKFQQCCINKTHVRESGLIVSTEVLAGETVLFFHIDTKHGRTALNLVEEGSKICDYLVFYAEDNRNEETICLLELKGKDLEGAIKQIISTYQQLSKLLKDEINGMQPQLIVLKACICMHGQAPRNIYRNIEPLVRAFGKNNIRIKHGYKFDLGSFLREKSK